MLTSRSSQNSHTGHTHEHGCSCCAADINPFASTTQAASGAGTERMPWRDTVRLGVSAALLASGLFLEYFFMGITPQYRDSFDVIFFGLPYVLCGYRVLLDAAKAMCKGDFFNEFTLMSGATVAAIALGELPEAVGVMLFYSIGELVQERAAGSSRRSIKALLASRPTVAHVLDDTGNLLDCRPEDLSTGARVVVKPGEIIPLDGEVVEGFSFVDTAPLTGESVPVRAGVGKKVYAGTINVEEALTIRVTAPFFASSVSRILAMVEHAAGRKAPTERCITRFARIYTPIVIIFAVLVAVLPPLFGFGGWHEWMYRALVLVVISCPCALVISIPLGYFGGIGAASRRGLLVKGGVVLDALTHIRVAAFDKTGTLTRGVFEVCDTQPVAGVDATALLKLAAQAESRSTHPVARAIVAAMPSVTAPDGARFREVAGRGVIADMAGQRVVVGNASFLEDNAINMPVAACEVAGTVVHVACSGMYMGWLAVSDALRPETPAALKALRAEGVERLVMLSGDAPENTRRMAEGLGFDEVRAGLLPEDKAAALDELGASERVMFVGDGLNDAPSIAAAGVGVAMGGLGSAAAIETADAVILDDSPSKLPELLRIAKKTRSIVQQNIVLSLGVKALVLLLGVAGISGLWEAVFADVGVALLAVLNARRAANG